MKFDAVIETQGTKAYKVSEIESPHNTAEEEAIRLRSLEYIIVPLKNNGAMLLPRGTITAISVTPCG